MQLLSIQVPEAYITGIDILILSGYFPNRSEAIRCAVRDLIDKELGGFKGIKESYMMVQNVKTMNQGNDEGIDGL
ncbi:MAG TPA: type II toxin-antitoxin system ParD family antitoxin [Candidatus Methanofastidiosa archaeon]|nr:type II toxin-antitoxin system ParD family antitoxin [Candidatus Methanofastidiosa archaeon]